MKLTSNMLLLAVPLSVLVLIFACRHMGYCLINIQDVDNNNTYVEGMQGMLDFRVADHGDIKVGNFPESIKGGCNTCGCGM